MKRRAKIASELAALRAQSHPGEYHAELRRIIVQDAAHEPILRRLLRELSSRYPEAYERATQQPKRSARRWRDASRLASWIEEQKRGVSKSAWVAKAGIDKKTLRDLQKRYDNDASFRIAVEELRSTMNLLGGTNS